MRNRHHSGLAVVVNLFIFIGVILPLKACWFTLTVVVPWIAFGARQDLYRLRLRVQRAYLIYKRDH